jgi:hypothetical protein
MKEMIGLPARDGTKKRSVDQRAFNEGLNY